MRDLVGNMNLLAYSANDNFEPRVLKAEWQRGNPSALPPGYVYEDIIEFVLPIMERAHLTEYGLRSDGKPDLTASVESKALGTQNAKEALDLIFPIISGDEALQARVTEFMRNLTKPTEAVLLPSLQLDDDIYTEEYEDGGVWDALTGLRDEME